MGNTHTKINKKNLNSDYKVNVIIKNDNQKLIDEKNKEKNREIMIKRLGELFNSD